MAMRSRIPRVLGVPPLDQQEFFNGLFALRLLFQELQRFLEDGVDHPALALTKADDQGLQFVVKPVLVQHPFDGAGDDQGGPGLIDENRVHFVHDGVVELPLDHVFDPELHVVPEVVEPELVVCAVGYVAAVGALAFGVVEFVDDDPDGEPEEVVDGPHPGRVALGQVVVHRDHVDSEAGKGVQVGGKGGCEGFAFAGLHLGDLALVEDDPADQLDVKMALSQGPPGSLPHHRESLGQKVVQSLAPGEPLAELRRLALELVVGQLQHLRFELIDGLDQRLEAA